MQHLRDEHAFGGGDSPLDGNLTAAAKVIGIGRGLAAKQDLPLIEELAAGLGAALGCSRPFAEELQWLPLERFIGISGQKLKGSFYLAIGLSGAVQHLAGIRDARVVAAINSDAKAPIFAHADYGIVGDLYEIVPLLRQALK
ncbi:MAG: FAD-binding protein [Sporomusaceae bacterium]|nr:FAD-binding protein [Sporomusaceae bacterium]